MSRRRTAALSLFTSGFAGTGYYRPLMALSLSIDAAIVRRAWLFHATNVLWHAVAAVLTWMAASTLGLSRRAAVAAGILFAVHPLTSLVTGAIAFRSEAMIAAALLALIVLHRKRHPAAALALNELCGSEQRRVGGGTELVAILGLTAQTAGPDEVGVLGYDGAKPRCHGGKVRVDGAATRVAAVEGPRHEHPGRAGAAAAVSGIHARCAIGISRARELRVADVVCPFSIKRLHVVVEAPGQRKNLPFQHGSQAFIALGPAMGTLTNAPRCDHWMFANRRLRRGSDVSRVRSDPFANGRPAPSAAKAPRAMATL